MTRLRTQLGLIIVAATLAMPVQADELSDTFNNGMTLLKRGRNDEALISFQRILAMNPDPQAAYSLWASVGQDEWLELLVMGGQFELVAKRITTLSTLARKELQNDADAIKEHLRNLKGTDDAIERRKITRALSADHGEYAVPYLVRALADQNDDEWRVAAMHCLIQMNTNVVPPLIEAMGSEDAFQVRNVAYTLGQISDPRAAGVLLAAAGDEDGSVREAAAGAAQACGGTGSALSHFLQDGDAYHHRKASVLRSFDYSDVVWDWQDGGLVAHGVPKALYNNEMSKKCYYRALDASPASAEARAGVARAAADIVAKLGRMAAAGEDTSGLDDQAANGALAVSAAGSDSLDLALRWSVATRDGATAGALCQALAHIATSPTEGLRAALASDDGGMKGEAAVALGTIAYMNGGNADAAVVNVLGVSAGREIARVAAIIDADGGRGSAVEAGLKGSGVLVNSRNSGASGLAMLHKVPGVDVVIIGDGLPDLTLDAVLRAIESNPVTANTPVYLMTSNADLAEAYGDSFAGSFSGADGLEVVNAAFEASLDGDRAEADRLSLDSAATLARLARTGTNISSVLGNLASTLASRPDGVTIAAMRALGSGGTANEAPALIAVVADDSRSDEARAAAADACAGIFGRHAVSIETASPLHVVLTSDTSLVVRQACARALGRLALEGNVRGALLQDVRVDVSAE